MQLLCDRYNGFTRARAYICTLRVQNLCPRVTFQIHFKVMVREA
jgi:hypothetical protein